MSIITKYEAPKKLNTPVLFLIFNRLETTKIVFHAIREAKPPRIYIASDGARSGKYAEANTVKAIRDYILLHIDWKCDIKTLFREENLGCKLAVSQAIDWFFKNEEKGIILEDDCLPSQSFFWYCEEMLNIYENDERVCSISGNLRTYNNIPGDNEIYKSVFFNMWGWATWRRQWIMYDVDLFTNKNSIEEIDRLFTSNKVKCYWEKVFKDMKINNIDTWDYQMFFLSFINNQYNIYPKSNMVKNIGFGTEATHTIGNNPKYESINITEMQFNENYKDIDDLENIDEKFYGEYSCKSFVPWLFEKLKHKTRILLFK